jgi:RNA-directed DNA polymerase
LESGKWKEAGEGTPQGAGISPLLANIFLHYVLDLWVHRRRQRAQGCVSIVRYADDFVLGFESETDARRMRAELAERMAKFGLALHEAKTRLILFGKFAAERQGEVSSTMPTGSSSAAIPCARRPPRPSPLDLAGGTME